MSGTLPSPPPSNLGTLGDSYRDNRTGIVFVKTSAGWMVRASGDPALPDDTRNGASFLTGAGEPLFATGFNGDTYLDAVTGQLYVKSNNAWSLGPGRVTGPQGVQGTAGTAFRSGAGAPAATAGVDGDTYVDLTTGELWSHVGGAWADTRMSLRGPQGAAPGPMSAADALAVLRAAAGALPGTAPATPDTPWNNQSALTITPAS